MGVLRASVFGWFVLTVMGCTSAPAPSTPPAAPVSSSAPFDVSAVIRQVQRSFREDGARWTTAGTGWALRTSEEGLELTAIHRPDAPLSLGLVGPQRRVESGAIRLGPTRLERGWWKQTTEGLKPARAHDGTLHLTGDGFVEQLENAEVGLEQSWHFESAPGTDGDLVLTIPVTGASHRGTTGTGEHLVDATSGLGFRVGHGTFIDAAGVETQVPVSFESGVLVLRVPETVLDRALFPAVLDPVISPEFGLDEPVPYTDPPAPQGSPSVASNGDGYLIAWGDLGQRLYAETVLAVRVDSRGVLLDPSPLVLSIGAANSSTPRPHPRATSNGTDYLVVWRGEGSRLQGVRVSATGAILDAEAFFISPEGVSDQPVLASNGVDYLVAWSGCHATRVTAAGQVLDPASLTPGTDFPTYGPPAIASNSNRYLLMCPSERVEPTDGSVVFGFAASSVFFDGGFSVDGGAIVEADGLFGYGAPSLIQAGDGFLAGWQQPVSSQVFALKGRYLSASGEPMGGPFNISEASCSGGLHLLRAAGSTLATWVDCNWAIRTAVVSADASVQVSSQTPGASQPRYGVTAASNGSTVLLAWNTGDLAMARLITTTGIPIDAGFELSRIPNLQLFPSVATSGHESLVVWQDGRNRSPYDFQIYGARVAHDGGILDPTGIAISKPPGVQLFASVATNGTDYLVTWTDFTRLTVPIISGTRVSRAGVVLDDGGLPIAVGLDAGYRHISRVASNGTDYLVAWGAGPVSFSSQHLVATRVSSAGAVLDPEGLLHSSTPYLGEPPSIASDGTDYLVVWSNWMTDAGVVLTGTRVTSSGVMLDPAGLRWTTRGAFNEMGASVASNGLSYLVAWEERPPTSGYPLRLFPYDLQRESERIKSVLVFRDGVVLDAGTLLLSPPTGERSAPTVASNGTDYLVAWQDRRSVSSFDIYGARVTGDGVSLDDGGFVLAGGFGNQALPSLSSLGGGDYVLAYNQHFTRWFPRRIKARMLGFNGPPVPRNLALTTAEDTALSVTLAATDPENEPFTFSIRRAPAHGRLSGMPPQLVYTPDADFSGTDTFEYRASDGRSTSRPGLVTLTVTPVNDAPVVQDTSLTFLQGQPISLQLSARDADADVLQYTLLASPTVGLLTGMIPNFTWQPPAGFRGAASLRFRVSDGTDAREGTVRWTVTNVAPTVTASASTTTTTEGERVQVFASASDPGQDTVELSWDFGDGTRSRDTAPFHVFERPGRFSVTVTASDGLAQATSFVDVDVGNGAPRLTVSLPVTADEGAPISMRADVRDSQATAATVTWDFGDGTPTAQGESVTHVFPDDGRFSVTVTATDAQGASRQVVREVTVFNVAPTPAAQALLSATPGTRVMTTLSATDPAGARDPLSWTLLQGPGALSADGQYTWEPRADEVGRFSIEARVTDDDTGAAIVRFDVQVASPAAPMGCTCTSVSPGSFVLALLALMFTRRRRIG